MALRVKAIADEAMHYVRIVDKCEDETLNEGVLELHKNDSCVCSFVANIAIPQVNAESELIECVRTAIKSALNGERAFPVWMTSEWIDLAGVVLPDTIVLGGEMP